PKCYGSTNGSGYASALIPPWLELPCSTVGGGAAFLLRAACSHDSARCRQTPLAGSCGCSRGTAVSAWFCVSAGAASLAGAVEAGRSLTTFSIGGSGLALSY